LFEFFDFLFLGAALRFERGDFTGLIFLRFVRLKPFRIQGLDGSDQVP
jgi:hypothetical protein